MRWLFAASRQDITYHAIDYAGYNKRALVFYQKRFQLAVSFQFRQMIANALIDVSAQDCSNSIANAMEPSIWFMFPEIDSTRWELTHCSRGATHIC